MSLRLQSVPFSVTRQQLPSCLTVTLAEESCDESNSGFNPPEASKIQVCRGGASSTFESKFDLEETLPSGEPAGPGKISSIGYHFAAASRGGMLW